MARLGLFRQPGRYPPASSQQLHPVLGYRIPSEYTWCVKKTKVAQAHGIFRELLRELRSAKRLTQAQLAERLGLPQSYVSKYETGERRLDFVETVLVCEALEMSLAEFAGAFASRMRGVSRAKSR